MTIKQILQSIRRSIDAECVSQGELAYLYNHKKDVLALGDIILAQWAGIPEEDWFNYRETRGF